MIDCVSVTTRGVEELKSDILSMIYTCSKLSLLIYKTRGGVSIFFPQFQKMDRLDLHVWWDHNMEMLFAL